MESISYMVIFYLMLTFKFQMTKSYTCPKDGWAHTFARGSCCDKEPFFLGDGRAEFAEECFAQPMNESLPYKENHWAFYECIIKKSLGDQPLNEMNYVQLMSKNLSDTNRVGIFNFLKQDIGSLEPAEGSSFRQKLKYYWKRYMDAEFSVCAVVIKERCKKIKNSQESSKCLKTARILYEPKFFCRQQAPALWANPQQYTEDQHNDCFENITTILKPYFGSGYESRRTVLDRAFFTCWYASVSPFKLEHLYTANLDFEKYFNYFAPRFLSNTARSLLINLIFQSLRKQSIPIDDSAPFKNFVRLAKRGDRINELNPNEQMVVNLEALTFMAHAIERAQAVICQQQYPHKY